MAPLAAHAAPHDDISHGAARIARDWPQLRQGTYVSADAWRALRDLAELCGMDRATADACNDADLISIYRVARTSPDSATRTAATVARRIMPQAGNVVAFAPTPTDPNAIADAVKRAMEPVRDALDDRLFTVAAGIRETLPALVADAVKAQTATTLVVQTPNAPDPVVLGLAHKQTAKIIRHLSCGGHVYLHGPPGSGKTTVAQQVAKALSLPFYAVAAVESSFLLLGFTTADGRTVRTAMREAYEFGGVLLFDELDYSGTSAATALNMALANKECPFPDALVPMHPDFKVIAAGNTTMRGAIQGHEGAEKHSAATLDRFDFIEFGYDEDLERALAPNADWCGYVQAVRATVKARGEYGLPVTPRATLRGGALLAAGMAWDEVAEAVIWKGIDADTRYAIEDATHYARKGA